MASRLPLAHCLLHDPNSSQLAFSLACTSFLHGILFLLNNQAIFPSPGAALSAIDVLRAFVHFAFHSLFPTFSRNSSAYFVLSLNYTLPYNCRRNILDSLFVCYGLFALISDLFLLLFE